MKNKFLYSCSIAYLLSCHTGLSACEVLTPSLAGDVLEGRDANGQSSFSPTRLLQPGSRLAGEGGSPKRGVGSQPLKPSTPPRVLDAPEKVGKENGPSSLSPNGGRGSSDRAAPSQVSPSRSAADVLGVGEGGQENVSPSTPLLSNAGKSRPAARVTSLQGPSSSHSSSRCLFGVGGASSTLLSLARTDETSPLQTSQPPGPPAHSPCGREGDVRASPPCPNSLWGSSSRGEVVVWSARGQTTSDSQFDAVSLPPGARVMNLQGPMNAFFCSSFPGVYPSQARRVVSQRLVAAVDESGVFEAPEVLDLVTAALEDGRFNPKIAEAVCSGVVGGEEYDEAYVAATVATTKEANPSRSDRAVRKAVIREMVNNIVNPDELRTFLPPEVVDEIVTQTFAVAQGDVTAIRAVAEKQIRQAIAEKKFIRASVEAVVKRAMTLEAIDGGSFRRLAINPALVVDPTTLSQQVMQALLTTPNHGALARVMVERGVVQRALQGLDDTAVTCHSNPMLIYPGHEGGIYYFLAPRIDDVTQFRRLSFSLDGAQSVEEVTFRHFVRRFNLTLGQGSVPVVRLVRFKEHFQREFWQDVARCQNLDSLLALYRANEGLFRRLLRESLTVTTTDAKNAVYSPLVTGRTFSGVLQPGPAADLGVNRSLAEAIHVAWVLHEKCQTEGGRNPLITTILAAAIIDTRDEISSIDYCWSETPQVGAAHLTPSESMVLVRIRRAGDGNPSQAFGVWTDHSLFEIPSAQATLAVAPADAGGASRMITDRGCSAAAAARASSVAAPPLAGSTRQTAAAPRNSAPTPGGGRASAAKRGAGNPPASGRQPEGKSCAVM